MFGKNGKHQVDLEVFTIFDSKTSSYDQPFFAINHHDIIRQIINMFQEPKQQKENRLFLNAEDFSIFRIATFDKKTGSLQVSNLEHIANMHDLRALAKPRPEPRNVTPATDDPALYPG